MKKSKNSLILACASTVLLAQSGLAFADLTEKQVENAKNLFQPNMFLDNNKSYKRDYYSPNNCHVKITETVQIMNLEVGNLGIKIDYYCHRPDHQYKCGGGPWTSPQRDHYQGYVFSNLGSNSGNLSLSNIKNHLTATGSLYQEGETNCAELLIDFLRSRSGSYIGTQ